MPESSLSGAGSDRLEGHGGIPAFAGNGTCPIALVGKYIQLHDAYISVVEALKHGGIASHATVNIKWINSEELNEGNAHGTSGRRKRHSGAPADSATAALTARSPPSIMPVPTRSPSWDSAWVCSWRLWSTARNVAGLEDAHSIELDPQTPHPVIALLPDQKRRGGHRRNPSSGGLSLCSGQTLQGVSPVRPGGDPRAPQTPL